MYGFSNAIMLANETFLKRMGDSAKIALPVMEGLLYVRAKDIVRCEASSNYTYIYFQNGKKIVASRTLAVYEKALKVEASLVCTTNTSLTSITSKNTYEAEVAW